MTEIGIYFSSFVFGLIGAWVIVNFGGRLGIFDHPNERSSHNIPTPKGGGIGIFAAFLFSCLYAGISVYFWLPLTLVSILAFWNDQNEFSPKWRLSFQFIFILFLLIGILSFSTDWLRHLPWILFGTIFIVGTANFYNFMDGINGIAGISGIVGFGLLAYYISLNQGPHPFFILSSCLSFSCLGFLPFNMPKARVFMGDIGSILLGSVFGSIVFLSSFTLLDFFCTVSFLFPFYADELTTMAVRLKDREKLFQPHRRHLYQLLANEKGFAHWKVSVGFGLLQLIVGLSILGVKPWGLLPVFALLGFYFTIFVMISYFVRESIQK